MNIIDKILLEFCFRCDSGYPKTDSDYHKLGEVLSEMTDLDVASIQRIVEHARTGNIISEQEAAIHSDYSNNTLKITETVNKYGQLLFEGYTKEDLIAVINNTPLPDKLIRYISRLIDSATSESSVIKSLQEKGYDELTAKRIFDKSVELDSYNQLKTLLTKPSTQFDFDALSTEGNLSIISNHIKFTPEFNSWLYTYKPTVGGVTSGNAENYLRIVLQGGHVPRRGDLGVYDKLVEVKVTISGGFRFRGQAGYGTGADVSKYIMSEISKIYEQKTGELLEWGNINTQLYYKSSISPLNDKIKELITSNILSREQFIDIYSNSLTQVYKNYNGDFKSLVAQPSIQQNGIIDINELLPRLAAVEFLYYASNEEWSSLIAIGRNKQYIMLDKEANFEQIRDLLNSKFLISPPVTTSKASVQDSLTKVEYKG